MSLPALTDDGELHACKYHPQPHTNVRNVALNYVAVADVDIINRVVVLILFKSAGIRGMLMDCS